VSRLIDLSIPLDNDIPAALALSAVLVLISFAVLIGVKIGARRWIQPS